MSTTRQRSSRMRQDRGRPRALGGGEPGQQIVQQGRRAGTVACSSISIYTRASSSAGVPPGRSLNSAAAD